MKMTNKFFALPVLMGALLIAGTTQNAHAVPTNTDDVLVTLQVDPIAEVTATDVNATLTPVRADYVAGYVTQANAISLNVFSNTPYIVTVEGQSGSPTLASADLLAKKNGAGSFTAVSAPVTIETSATPSAVAGDTISVDLRVALANTAAYAADASHTNTVTFTVTAGAD